MQAGLVCWCNVNTFMTGAVMVLAVAERMRVERDTVCTESDVPRDVGLANRRRRFSGICQTASRSACPRRRRSCSCSAFWRSAIAVPGNC
ncbi:hypothetical protein pipiens_016736 [Culex pipiens pipiens]|uniref:Uncharacterized protein n=1 Tax=Culex pipiens pipiens TaxID=38569 RepID=A0ABD1CK26_CULPP